MAYYVMDENGPRQHGPTMPSKEVAEQFIAYWGLDNVKIIEVIE